MPGLSEVAQLIAQLQAMDSRIKTLETALRAQNTSVDAGAFKILSDEGFQVGAEGSGTGSARVYGVLFINGVLQLIGALEVDEDGSISLGGITITRDVLDVAGGAVIQVGDGVILSPDSITVNADGTVTIGDIILSGASGGSFSAPVKITLSAPLVDVIGALNVSQALVAEGTVTMPNLSAAPGGATTLPLVCNTATGRVHLG